MDPWFINITGLTVQQKEVIKVLLISGEWKISNVALDFNDGPKLFPFCAFIVIRLTRMKSVDIAVQTGQKKKPMKRQLNC